LEEFRFFDHVHKDILQTTLHIEQLGEDWGDKWMTNFLSYIVLFVVGSACLVAYYYCGCCGGGGVQRHRSALPPVAVLVDNEALVQALLQNHNVEEAELRKKSQPWWERVFIPVLVADDLERRPPRRPKGTVKVIMPTGCKPAGTSSGAGGGPTSDTWCGKALRRVVASLNKGSNVPLPMNQSDIGLQSSDHCTNHLLSRCDLHLHVCVDLVL